MTTLPFVDDHVDQAVAYLLTQFQGKTKLVAFLTGYITQIQDLENSASDLYTLRDLNSAIGAQLDLLGDVVGYARQGLTDDVYRLYLRAIVIANRSSGTSEEELNLVRLVTNHPSLTADIHILDYPPARFVVFCGENIGSADPNVILTLIKLAKSAGVAVTFEYATTGTSFVFDTGIGAGFGDATDPSVGGAFVGVV